MTSASPHSVSFGSGAAGSCSGGESKDARNVAPPGRGPLGLHDDNSDGII